MDNWPQSIEIELNDISPPVLADIDGDMDLEVIVGGEVYGTNDNILFVWQHDGTMLSPWPVTFDHGNVISYGFGTPAVGDIDGDYKMEIVVNVAPCMP